MARRWPAACVAAGAITIGLAGGTAGAASSSPLGAVLPPAIRPAEGPALLDRRPETMMMQLRGAPIGRYLARRPRHTLPARRVRAIRAALLRRQEALRPRVRAAGARILGQYQYAYDGIKVLATPAQAAALADLPGVVAVRRMTPVQPALTTSVPSIGADAAWADLGTTGAGVKIAIIDSGVDYYHADLGGSGNPADFAADDGLTIGTPAFPNAKVAGGYDLVGDAYTAGAGAAGIPHPDPDPLDCAGHGTHVAGIAAGQGVLADGTRSAARTTRPPTRRTRSWWGPGWRPARPSTRTASSVAPARPTRSWTPSTGPCRTAWT